MEKVLFGDDEVFKMYCKLKELKRTLKETKDKIDYLTKKVKDYMGENEVCCNGRDTDIVLFTYKQSAGFKKFDEKAFKAAQPYTYEEYLKEVEGPRRLVLVDKSVEDIG